MKILLSLLLGFLTGHLLFAQIQLDRQVIASFGSYDAVGNLLVTSTVGESTTFTAATGSFAYTQGFQQPDVYPNVGIDDPLSVFVGYSFFPNPTDQLLYIELNTAVPIEIQMELYDMAGKLTAVKIDPLKVHGQVETQADLSSLADGVYQLLLKNESGQALHSVKIRKIH
ncbi:MAG: T9SS type A sorting domain-containing protein [Bacteroidia bacterium]|nr:T9SS type A sorting domain-containing protein [Bacteroidia bacterium]